MVEFPQGHIIEERRGGASVLASLIAEMVKLDSSGIVRTERKPENMMPRVGQVFVQKGAMIAAIHDSEEVIEGLQALIEIEDDCLELDCIIQISEGIELSKVLDMYPDSIINVDAPEQSKSSKWWNEVKSRPEGWSRASRLPELEASESAPEFIQRKAAAMINRNYENDLVLKPGSVFLLDSKSGSEIFDLANVLEDHGRPVLVISRQNTDELIEKHDLERKSCLWLSQTEGKGVQIAEIDSIKKTAHEFFAEKIRSVLLLEGIEYLAAICGEKAVINLLRELADQVKYEDDCLLIAADLEAFDKKDAILIAREAPLLDSQNITSWILDSDSLLEHPLLAPLSEEELEQLAQHVEETLPQETKLEDIVEEIINEPIEIVEEIPIEFEEEIIIIEETEVPEVVEEIPVKKGPRVAQRVKRRAPSSPTKMGDRQILRSGLAAALGGEIIAEMPTPKPVPQLAVGNVEISELPEIPNIVPSSLDEVLRQPAAKKNAKMPSTELGPKPLESAASKQDAEAMSGPLDARGVKLETSSANRSQTAAREQTERDIDAELQSWKKNGDDEK